MAQAGFGEVYEIFRRIPRWVCTTIQSCGGTPYGFDDDGFCGADGTSHMYVYVRRLQEFNQISGVHTGTIGARFMVDAYTNGVQIGSYQCTEFDPGPKLRIARIWEPGCEESRVKEMFDELLAQNLNGSDVLRRKIEIVAKKKAKHQ